MKKSVFSFVFILLFNFLFSQYINHDLDVTINIQGNSIEVVDVLSIPENLYKPKSHFIFQLNMNLTVELLNNDLKLIETIKAENDIHTRKYELHYADIKPEQIKLKYKGKIFDEIETGAAEYARGFSETSGIISEKGVYLAGSTNWIPQFEKTELSTFSMNVKIDSAWNVVTQGERTINEKENDKSIIKYDSPDPVDEIYLIAAKWTEYSLVSNNILVQAFLRTPDEALANRYLKVTSNYLKLYENLIGPYPYKKFALVENFWETGYGMPSFTLLGEKVIRFPWILHSSYPHELLHNYWGNSVFVDYGSGNWCEGITVYMADHLIKEQQGQGAEYRRTTLQKFTDYVNEENDFPVTEFRSRSNSAEEAIGYGKTLMINNMLRDKLGDSLFIEGYRHFYENNKFKKAAYKDIRESMEATSGFDLKPFFEQWLTRKGAPRLQLSNVTVKEKKGKYTLGFNLDQIQDSEAFTIQIPIAVYLENHEFVDWEVFSTGTKEKNIEFTYDSRPLKVEIDPQFNVFRLLDRKEVPPSLSQVFGSMKSKIVLPKKSKLYEAYKEMADTWAQTQKIQGKNIDVIDDTEVESLPENEVFWIFGKENKFAQGIDIPDAYKLSLPDNVLENMNTAHEKGSFVYAISHPENESITIGFVSAENEAAIKGLTRKLPHYGKYGYLGFEGDAPTNNMKGSFAAVNSPLSYIIKYDGEMPEIKAKIIPRKALAFSHQK